MENLLLFLSYILYSIVGFSLTISIIDSRIGWNKIIPIGIASGIADFLVKEIIVTKFNLPDGMHFITGVLLIALVSYGLLKLRIGISFGVSFLTYIVSAISEITIMLIFMMIFGKETLVAWSMSKLTVILLGFLAMTPMIIAVAYIRIKNVKVLDNQISNNFYRV